MSDFLGEFLSQKQIPLLLNKSLSVQTVKQLLELLSMVPAATKKEITGKLLSLLQDRICSSELPKLQSEEYIILRSKFGINSFPFDNLTMSA
jgi:hypothetical protein